MTSNRDHCPPRLDELMAHYMAGQAAAPVGGEVEPFEAVPAASVDARQAWDAAASPVGAKVKAPAGWAALVASLEGQTALPMAAGNYPQAVRDVRALLQGIGLDMPGKGEASAAEDRSLIGWARRLAETNDAAAWLLAAGVLRRARQFDAAEQFLADKCSALPAGCADDLVNERAALAWHRGNRDEAAKLWGGLPETAASLFNRGLAELTAGRAQEAQPLFRAAIAKLSDSSSWYHLAQLYLALAESR